MAKLMVCSLSVGLCVVACSAPRPNAASATNARVNPTASSSSPIEAAARTFVDELARGDFQHDKTSFDTAMAEAMPPKELHELWAKLERESGGFRAVDATRLESKNGYQLALVTCRFERLRKTLRVVFDADGQVAGLFYGPVAEDIEAKTRRLVNAASTGKFELAAEDFGEDMKGALPPAKLAVTWAQLEGKVGHLKAISSVELKPEHGHWSSLATAQFEKDTFVIKVVYDVRDEVAGLFFLPLPVAWSAPPYAKPASFEEHDVKVGTAPALPGTLTVPKGAGPFPAIVLVHGSGPNDQDESIGGTKPFKDLAWGLASKGIVVLRYVKRSRHSPAGVVTQKEEVLDAAHDAIELLRATPGVDPKRVFVAGHSQGGYLVPRIAEANPSLAGAVILAGPTISLQDSMVEQRTYFASLDPNNAELRAKVEEAKKFKRAVESADLRADQVLTFPGGGAVKGAYFLDVRGYAPEVLAEKLGCRLLVLQGERDYQVTLATDFAGWKKTLAKKKTATLRTYASLNHLFVSGKGTPSPAEYEEPGHVDEPVVSDIATWIMAPM